MASLEMRVEAERSLAFGSIGASYTAVGDPFGRPIRVVLIQNLTDALLTFSFDGVVDHITLHPLSAFTFDICTNDVQSLGFFGSKGTQMYVKQSGVPTSGSVYISAFYARGS